MKRENPALKEKYGYLLISNNKEEAIATIYEHAVCYVGDTFLNQAKTIADKSNIDKLESGFLLYFDISFISPNSKTELQILDISDKFIREVDSLDLSNSLIDDLKIYIENIDKRRVFSYGRHIIGFGHTHPIAALDAGGKINNPRARNRPSFSPFSPKDTQGVPFRNYENNQIERGYISAIVTELGFTFYPTMSSAKMGYNPYYTIQEQQIQVFNYSKAIIFDGEGSQFNN